MRKDFSDRDALIDYAKKQFPDAAAIDGHVSEIRGGRHAAEATLHKIQPLRYKKSRNFLNGAVTRLSPYIRHGVLSLAEVRDYALEKANRPEEADKLINELGWRDYFQRVYEAIGGGIWQDREPYKTGVRRYEDELPVDIREGQTGLACMDAFRDELHHTGYLHNHARMWMAAYVVHWRRIRWQAGAKWFLEHLLDGDPASNNLSWQWVASTFSHKPYIFNRENLEKYTDGVYCKECPLADACPFDASYDALQAKLFAPYNPPPTNPKHPVRPQYRTEPSNQSIAWVHGDCMSPYSPALAEGFPSVWVWDDRLLANISLKRIVFMYENLLELPVEIRRGDVAEEIADFAALYSANTIVTTGSPSPDFDAIVERLEKRGYNVDVRQVEPFLNFAGTFDLKRFSRYWRKAQKYAY